MPEAREEDRGKEERVPIGGFKRFESVFREELEYLPFRESVIGVDGDVVRRIKPLIRGYVDEDDAVRNQDLANRAQGGTSVRDAFVIENV